MAGITNGKFCYCRAALILHRNIIAFRKFLEIHMTTATITHAQDKGLRHQFADAAGNVLDFCRKLYAAYGGNIGPAPRREKKMSPAQLLELADRFEAYSPTLSAEIRSLAARA
jgi:hypothetical protein